MSENKVSEPVSDAPFSIFSSPDISRYEQACDQAILMCDGNLRSTIKALIMANEYLEAELEIALSSHGSHTQDSSANVRRVAINAA